MDCTATDFGVARPGAPAEEQAVSESEAARVLVIGAVNVDLVVESDRLPGPGETVVGSDLVRHGGGKGANAAVAAARAGASVRFCGAVGDEDMGASALDGLAGEGVDTSHVAVIDGVSTGAALIVVDRDGENQIAVAAGANRRVNPGRCRGAVEHARSWDAGCVLVSTEIPAAVVSAALGAARDQGIPTVLNPAPVSAGIIDVLTTADVLTPNSAELGGLYRGLFAPGTTPSVPQMAHAVAEHCGVTVVVTLGADGALVADGRRTTPFPRSRSTRWWTPPVPGTRSTASWRRHWPPGTTSRQPCVAASRPDRCRRRGQVRGRGCPRPTPSPGRCAPARRDD